MSKMIATGCQNKAMSYVRCTCRCLKVIPTTLLNFPSEFNCRIKKPKGPRDPPAEWSRVERWHSSHIPGLDTSLCLTSNGNGLFIYFYLLWTSTVCDHRNTVIYLSIYLSFVTHLSLYIFQFLWFILLMNEKTILNHFQFWDRYWFWIPFTDWSAVVL